MRSQRLIAALAMFCVVLTVCSYVAPVHADRVAIGNSTGGLSIFEGNPSNLTAGPGNCCFISSTDGLITVEWLDFDHLAIGGYNTTSPTSSDFSVRQPFNGYAVTHGGGGTGAPVNTFAGSTDGSLFFIGASNRNNMQIRPKIDGNPGTNCCSGPGGTVADSVGGLSGGPDGSYLVLFDNDDPATGPTSLRKIAFGQLEQQNNPIADIVVPLSGNEIGTSGALLSDGNLIIGKKGVDFSPNKGGVSRVNGTTLLDMGGNCCHPDPVIDVDGDSQGRGIYITSGPVANGELVRTDFAGGNGILAGGGLNNTASGAMTALAVLSNDDILIGFTNGDIKQFSPSGGHSLLGNVGSAVNAIDVVVPEPSAVLALLVGLAMLATRRRIG